ncbi:hypothetical protein D3C72_2456780 [compost metagenome]
MAYLTGQGFDLALQAPYSSHKVVSLLGELVRAGLSFFPSHTLNVEQLIQAPDNADVGGIHCAVGRISG